MSLLVLEYLVMERHHLVQANIGVPIVPNHQHLLKILAPLVKKMVVMDGDKVELNCLSLNQLLTRRVLQVFLKFLSFVINQYLSKINIIGKTLLVNKLQVTERLQSIISNTSIFIIHY